MMGEYEVVGSREYRGHKPGAVFEARLDLHAAIRAQARGDIRLIRRVEPELQPGSWELPAGWGDPAHTTRPKDGSSVGRRKR